ncbi:MAG: FliH/SctL family protein [Planctomycetaceae bacterium]
MSHHRLTFDSPIRSVRLRGERSPSTSEAEGTATPKAAPQPASVTVDHFGPLVQSLLDAIDEHEQRRQQSLSELQVVAVELAVAAAERVIGELAEASATSLGLLVEQGLQHLDPLEPLIVSLHPLDLEQLQAELTAHHPSWRGSIELRPARDVRRGGCRIERDDGTGIRADLTSRIAEIRTLWLENLDDTQAERRHDAAANSSLRRFPDRREAQERA